MKFSTSILAAIAATLAMGDSSSPPPPNDQIKPFTYNETTFMLDEKPFQVLAGQTDFQRIPRDQWRNRLQMIRAMGLNTVATYVYWDEVEKEQGQFDWTGGNNISEFFKIAQEEGLKGLLRPGPYVCAEHEWGGFPYWLNNIQGMSVRKNNEPFLQVSTKYIQQLAEQVNTNLASSGGNILMVQVENELGSFNDYQDQDDIKYKYRMRDIFLNAGFHDVPLYTTDGTGKTNVLGGQINNTLCETDGSATGYQDRDKILTDAGLEDHIGAWGNMEYYTTWLDHWGDEHHGSTPDSSKTVQDDLKGIMERGQSFALYDVHGGTNFGFSNGANYDDRLQVTTTSYDYGAPIDESGRITDLYRAIRKTIGDHIGQENLPEIPDMPEMLKIPPFHVEACSRLFDKLASAPIKNKKPLNMEQLGQAHGHTIYRHKVTKNVKGVLNAGDKPRDRVIVYVNSKKIGVIDDTMRPLATIDLDLQKGDTLDIMVENLGRVNYGPKIVDQKKGVVGDIKVGDSLLDNWEMYSIDFKDGAGSYTDDCNLDSGEHQNNGDNFTPTFYTGDFHVDTVSDTFMATPGWGRGVVFINGNNLGRYFHIGPQQELYVPSSFLKQGKNKIAIFEIEGTNSTEIYGTDKRTWSTNTA